MKGRKAIFRALPGAMFDDDEAQVIGEFLYGLAGEKSDTLTPHEVLEAARPKGSPIHGFFNWDDTAAAESWRLQQARQLTNHLEVVVIGDEGERSVRAFMSVSLPEDSDVGDRRVYMTAKVVASSEYFRSQAVASALSEVRRWQARYRDYKELALIFGAIEATQKRLRFEERRQPEARA